MSSTTSIGQRLADLLAKRHLGPYLLHLLHALGQVGAQLVERLELARLARELVVEIGQLAFLDLFHEHTEVQRRRVLVARVRRVELEDVAGLGAEQLLVELGHDRAAADLVEIVVGGEPLERLAVLRAGDVDRRVVVGGDRALDDLELTELRARAARAVRRSLRRSGSATGW